MFSGFYKDPLELSLPLGFELDPLFSVPAPSSMVPSRQRTNSRSETIKVPFKDPNVYKVMFVVKQFHPDDITVKVVDNIVEVHAKHEEKADEHGLISREFTRRHKLPSDVNPKDLTATMSRDGLLVISVPRKVQEQPNTRLVRVKFVDSALAAVESGHQDRTLSPPVGEKVMQVSYQKTKPAHQVKNDQKAQ